MPATATAARQWGRYVTDFTGACPRLAVSTLTLPQVDSIYLHDFSAVTLSFQAIADLYQCTKTTIYRHHQRGWKRLEAAGAAPLAPAEPSPADGPRVPCCGCDTPWLDCTTCIAVYVIGGCDLPPVRYDRRRRSTPRNLKRIPTVEELSAHEFKTTVDLKHFAEHSAKGEDWFTGRVDTASPGLLMQDEEDADWVSLG